MKLRILTPICVAVLTIAAAAAAHADAVYVSGLQHTTLGTAQLGTVDGRRLPVHNLGSSGEDGVEIQLHSALGGGAEVDLEPFLSTPGATLRHKYKGWDGTIYGTHRLVSNGDGSALYTLDYSEAGATGILVQELDANGIVISSTEYVGPIVDLPLNDQEFICPPDCIKTWRWWTGQLCSTCPIITHIVFTCTCAGGGGGTDYTERTITPIFPPGTPDSPGLESVSITASGLPELVVSDADIRTFGVPSWGLGQAQLSEVCTPDNMGTCDENDRRLVVSNLGSSGEDGVAVNLPGDTGGFTATTAKGNCCRGHVIIMKLYDDEGQEQRIVRTQTNDPTGTEELDADFSSLGATGYVLTLLDPNGLVVGPPEGTAVLNGGPKPTITSRCPVGSNEIWENIGTVANPVWHFVGCTPTSLPFDFVLPDGTFVPNVASYRIAPLDATSSFGRPTQCVITSDDDTEGLIIEDFAVTHALRGDLNCDGTVDFGDINPFVKRLTDPTAYAAQHPTCPNANGDVDDSGAVDFGDINPFVKLLTSP